MKLSKLFAALLCLPLLCSLAIAEPPVVVQTLPDLQTTDPATSSDPNNQLGVRVNSVMTGKNNTPNFSNQYLLNMFNWIGHGWNQSDGRAKLTQGIFSGHQVAAGEGQAIAYVFQQTKYGMGDGLTALIATWFRNGVKDAGGEGTSGVSIQLRQDPSPCRGHVLSVTRSPVNTVTTAAIVLPNDASSLTVPVADTTGLTPGAWAIVEPQPLGSPLEANQEAIKIITLTATSITAKFQRPHAAGVAVIGAHVLRLDNVGGFGQGRLLVNLSQPSYSLGSAQAVQGKHRILGTGTSWTAGTGPLPGGSVLNPGAISFTADDVTVAGKLIKAWYSLVHFGDASTAALDHWSQVGRAGYAGFSGRPGSSTAYTISPSAIILAFEPMSGSQQGGGRVVLSPNGFTWSGPDPLTPGSPGDLVDCAVSTSADVTGLVMRLAAYLPGGNYQSAFTVRNSGPRQFYSAYSADGDDGGTFKFGFTVTACETGMKIINPTTEALDLRGANSAIVWTNPHGDRFSIGPNPDPTARDFQFVINGKVALSIAPDATVKAAITP
jgi:hypothetical protein